MPESGSKKLLIGQTLQCAASPFEVKPETAFRHSSAGAILIQDGLIAETGEAGRLRPVHRDAEIHDYSGCLLLPGFIDPHVHFPQTAIIAGWGKGC